MEELIKNIKIVCIDYDLLTMNFHVVYSYSIGGIESKQRVCVVNRCNENLTVLELLDILKEDVYENLTLKEIAPFYKPEKPFYHESIGDFAPSHMTGGE